MSYTKPSAFIKFIIRNFFYLLGVTVAVHSGNGQNSSYDEIWDKVVLYENKDSSVIQKFTLTGRLQADYHSFENDVDGSSDDDSQWRRFRFGFKAGLFGGVTLHSEANMNLNQPEPLYRNLTDTYLSWLTDTGIKIKVGKQSAPFTLHGSTSSKKLYTLERGKIARNIWFTNEYFTGASLSGSHENWDYLAGIYSSDEGPEFDEAFDYGTFGLFSIGYNFEESEYFDNSLLRFDLMMQEKDALNQTPEHKNAFSIVTKLKKGKLNFWGDLSFSNGYGSQSDVWGTQLMPFYDFTDKIQGVFSYTYVESKDALDVDVTRYERDLAGRGDEMKEYFFGVNYFFYGHKLKWQNAIQYSEMDNLGTKVYEGWGYTSGLRISW
jgi:phosphate-selective porin OprO and OprP